MSGITSSAEKESRELSGSPIAAEAAQCKTIFSKNDGKWRTVPPKEKASSNSGEDASGEALKDKESAPVVKLTREELKTLQPAYTDKFRPAIVQSVIMRTVREFLSTKEYDAKQVQGWIKYLASVVTKRVTELKFPRYKIVTHVTIGEQPAQHGEGIAVGTQCLWDGDSDSSAFYNFLNKTLFCNVIVYGVYFL